MNKLNVKIFFLVIVLLSVFNSFTFAQKKVEPKTIKKEAYLKTRDKELEKALRKWNGNSADEFRYHFNMVDLNDDGKLDAVVFVSGDAFCGTGGCQMLIFRNNGKGFDLLTEMSVSRPPLWVSSVKTKGWKDLVIYVSGGGAKPYYSLLKFNGKTYPENPTVEPALPKNSPAKFTEYLSGIDTYDTGFEIK